MFLKTGWPKEEVNEVSKLVVSRQPDEEQYRRGAGDQEQDRTIVLIACHTRVTHMV